MKNYLFFAFIVICSVTAAQQQGKPEDGCVNGQWQEDTCVCNKGYETVPKIDTAPSYCSKRSVVVIHIVHSSPWNHRNVLDLTLPIFCVYILGCCVVGLVYTCWQIGLQFWSGETLRKLKIERAEFNKMLKKYKNVKMLDADVWELPSIDFTILNSVEGKHLVQYKRAKVLHDYKAEHAEELNLQKGDVIVDILELENGWWQGDLNGHIGYFSGNFVKFLDNTKKTGSAIEMDDPQWTQGIQETTKTLQYKKDNTKSKKNDEEIVSETSSMYLKDLAELKKTLDKTPKKEWMRKSSDDVTVVTKKRKSKVSKEDEEELLVFSDSQSEYGAIRKDDHKSRKEKEGEKPAKDAKEMHVEDKMFPTEDENQSSEEKQKKKRSKGKKHGKQGKEKNTEDSKQSLLGSESQMSAEKDERKKQKKDEEKEKKKSLQESHSQMSLEREGRKKERKGKKKKKSDMREEASADKQNDEKERKRRRKESKSERQQSITQSDMSDEKQPKKKQESKRKQKKTLSDEDFYVKEPSVDKKHRKEKQTKNKWEQKTSSETERSSGERKKKQSKGKQLKKTVTESTDKTSVRARKKSKGKQSKGKRYVTESSDDTSSDARKKDKGSDDDDDELSMTFSDVQFLTESEEEKPKKGFFKKLFKF